MLLRAGLALSVALMSSGLALWIGKGTRLAPSTTPAQLLGDLDPGHRLMLAGLLLLALTPALRVIALLVLWLRERAWRFAGTAALVLLLLGIALWAGGG